MLKLKLLDTVMHLGGGMSVHLHSHFADNSQNYFIL